MRDMCLVKRNGAAAANILTSVRKTPAAGLRNLVAADRTLVTCDVDDLNHIGIGAVPAHGKLHSLRKNRPLLVDAAAHGRLIPRHNRLGNIDDVFKKLVTPCKPRNLAEHLIFQMLYFGIKFSHSRYLPSLKYPYQK